MDLYRLLRSLTVASVRNFNPIRTCHLLCGVLVSAGSLHAAQPGPTRLSANSTHTNVTPFALAQAEQAPFGSDPMRLVRGQGAWQNAGPNPTGPDRESIARMPVNEAYPSWFILVWPEPIPLSTDDPSDGTVVGAIGYAAWDGRRNPGQVKIFG